MKSSLTKLTNEQINARRLGAGLVGSSAEVVLSPSLRVAWGRSQVPKAVGAWVNVPNDWKLFGRATPTESWRTRHQADSNLPAKTSPFSYDTANSLSTSSAGVKFFDRYHITVQTGYPINPTVIGYIRLAIGTTLENLFNQVFLRAINSIKGIESAIYSFPVIRLNVTRNTSYSEDKSLTKWGKAFDPSSVRHIKFFINRPSPMSPEVQSGERWMLFFSKLTWERNSMGSEEKS